MKKIAVIINPTSGKGTGEKFYNKIKTYLQQFSNIDTFLTERPLHATEITEHATNYSRIIICGGDGTLHEVINGFNLNSNTILGLIPIGSGNDFSLSFHKDKIAPKRLLEYYLSKNPKIRKVDFANVNIKDSLGNIFNSRMINSFGVGFDAKVAYYNQNNKVLAGTLSYISAIVKALSEFTGIDYNAILDNNIKISGSGLFCAVGNGKSIGGGLYLMPNAEVDDGSLDLSIVTIKSRLKLISLLPKALSNSLEKRDELIQYRFKNLDLSLKNPFYLHIDGEIITDKAKDITINIAEQKLNFMCKFT